MSTHEGGQDVQIQQQTPSSYRIVVIHDEADLTLNIIGITTRYDSASRLEQEVDRECVCFQVNRTKLSGLPGALHTKRTAIEIMLSSTWQESMQTEVTFSVSIDELRGAELLLHIFGDREVPNRLLQVPPEDLWHLAVALNYWNVSQSDVLVRGFFDLWFKEASRSRQQRTDDEVVNYLRTLLWPAWYYDHPAAFLLITRYLIYHSAGHIEAHNPTYYEIKLPRSIVGKSSLLHCSHD